MVLTEIQYKQVEMQLENHRHSKYYTNIDISPYFILRDFAVYENVMRPEVITSLHVARFLYQNSEYYRDKIAIDMGSGSGIQGIVMGLNGAKKVIFSDKFDCAYKNTFENVNKFSLPCETEVIQGDLFENITEQGEITVFNQPFFGAKPYKDQPASYSMLDEGDLINRFLEQNQSPVILMSHFDLAGDINNPLRRGPEHGYFMITTSRKIVSEGLQKGIIRIFVLRNGGKNGRKS